MMRRQEEDAVGKKRRKQNRNQRTIEICIGRLRRVGTKGGLALSAFWRTRKETKLVKGFNINLY